MDNLRIFFWYMILLLIFTLLSIITAGALSVLFSGVMTVYWLFVGVEFSITVEKYYEYFHMSLLSFLFIRSFGWFVKSMGE